MNLDLIIFFKNVTATSVLAVTTPVTGHKGFQKGNQKRRMKAAFLSFQMC